MHGSKIYHGQLWRDLGEIRVIIRSGLGLWLALGLRLHGTKVAAVTLYRLHSWQAVVYVVYTTDGAFDQV